MYRRLLALALVALTAMPEIVIAQTLDRAAPFDFQGRYLISVSDADMLASAYVDGRLGLLKGEMH